MTLQWNQRIAANDLAPLRLTAAFPRVGMDYGVSFPSHLIRLRKEGRYRHFAELEGVLGNFQRPASGWEAAAHVSGTNRLCFALERRLERRMAKNRLLSSLQAMSRMKLPCERSMPCYQAEPKWRAGCPSFGLPVHMKGRL